MSVKKVTMRDRIILAILLAGVSSPACLGAPVPAGPEIVETRPVQVNLIGGEAITVIEKGGITNTDIIKRTVKSMTESGPGLNVVQDQQLAGELSSWLDRPTQATLAAYLDKPVIRQKLDLYRLKYLVVVEHDWWGIEAQIWNLHYRELDGVIHGKSLVKSSKISCSPNPGTWIIGTAATMLYIPYATMTMAGLTAERALANTHIAIENFRVHENANTAQVDSYLSISESVVQNGSEAIRGVPIPCESITTLSSDPGIDSTALGAYLAGKFNKNPAIAGK